MKQALILAVCFSILLAGCGSKAPETVATAEAEAVPTAAAAVPAAGGVPTKDFIIGKWGDNGDCELAIEFKADGTMVGPFEKWELDDKGVLTMIGNPQKMHLKVVDSDNMESRLDGTGEPRRINRCK
jgi:hypothetical protein